MCVACVAAKLLAALGLGALVRTLKVAGGGQPNWWFVGKPVDPQDHELFNLLDVHATSTPSLATVTERNAAALEKPLRAPDITWSDYAAVPANRNLVLRFLNLELAAVLSPDAPAGAAPAGDAQPEFPATQPDGAVAPQAPAGAAPADDAQAGTQPAQPVGSAATLTAARSAATPTAVRSATTHTAAASAFPSHPARTAETDGPLAAALAANDFAAASQIAQNLLAAVPRRRPLRPALFSMPLNPLARTTSELLHNGVDDDVAPARQRRRLTSPEGLPSSSESRGAGVGEGEAGQQSWEAGPADFSGGADAQGASAPPDVDLYADTDIGQDDDERNEYFVDMNESGGAADNFGGA